MNKLTNLKHYRKEYVRALYGKLGKESGLNPGVAWPRKEELRYIKQYEEAFCPKLEDLIEENRIKKENLVQARKAREEEILKNLEKYPQELKSFFEQIEEKKQEKRQWLEKREKLIEEVREILGYRAKPTDERFLQAMATKEEEDAKKKRKEERKKKESSIFDEIV